MQILSAQWLSTVKFMENILKKILKNKQLEIDALDAPTLRHAAEQSPSPQDFLSAITRHGLENPVKLIAELKRASPSKGIFAPDLNLVETGTIYEKNGAAAISILTDENFFMGHIHTLKTLSSLDAVTKPLLRKDFIIDETQLYESRANGADAVLLIAAVLTDDSHFADLHAMALGLEMTPLVEVHNEAETERVLRLNDIQLIGINNRDLTTFKVSLQTTEQLRPLIQPGITVVSESGIFNASDVMRLSKANVDAILVGEALVTAPDIAAKVRELSNVNPEKINSVLSQE